MPDYTKAGNGNTGFDGTEHPPPALPHFRARRGVNMTEKVGETVRDNADYRCEQCHKITGMTKAR
jgi:hypothetical protein